MHDVTFCIIFYALSIWGYLIIESFYKVGILISLLNVMTIAIYRGRTALVVSILLLFVQSFYEYCNKRDLAYASFVCLAIVFPFSGKLANDKDILWKAKDDSARTRELERKRLAEKRELSQLTEDIVQKAKDSARTRELERKRLAAERALTSPVNRNIYK